MLFLVTLVTDNTQTYTVPQLWQHAVYCNIDTLAEVSILLVEVVDPVILSLNVDVRNVHGFVVSAASQAARQTTTGYQLL